MWSQYDENLQNNPFFLEIIKNHGDLVVKASQENWIICVPRIGVIDPSEITIETILDHILVPSDRVVYTLSKKQVTIKNKEIVISDRPRTLHILFEETFYIQDLKYTVFCIDSPLFTNRMICTNEVYNIETLHDCIDFLWSENLSHVLIKIQRLCASFIDQNCSFCMENLQNQKDLIGSLYSQCLQLVLKNRSFTDCDHIKLAVETYMQSCLDKFLIRAINTVTCVADSDLNKIIRNSSELQLKDLSIPRKFCDNITNAKSELSKINNFVTILDKVNCIKLTFNHLYTNICLTSDDVLQLFVFLILKLNISNWTSNLVYLTQFQFSTHTPNESNFLVTSLEAALEFIKSEQFAKIKSSHSTTPLFQTIVTDDLAHLRKLLETKKSDTNLCHPLCDCDNCKVVDSSHDIAAVNHRGQSLLTFATVLGRTEIVEFLISLGAEVNSVDYFGRSALHYACLKGFQDVLLILVNCKAEVNVRDHDRNTPLHVACNNGHENCVKALFYTSKGLDIDCVNKHGDTPLHLAIKWNYVGIVRVLIENNANACIANRKNQLPVSLAQNYYTERLLGQFSEPESGPKTTQCQIDQFKKIDLLLKAIENNDLPLTCFYLGFPNSSKHYDFQSKCHPLCNCEKCEDLDTGQDSNVERINVNSCNIDGFTPLHFAAKYGRIELLRILLDSGALPNLKTYKTLQTPLHLACINQQLSVVKELVKCGNCEVDSQDYNGNTPLYYACVRNDAKIAQVLLTNGANADIRDFQGNSIIKEVQEKSLM
ncbi:ankyrin repeat domain-containing protein 27-like [Tribolium madens]|uniref:ankyrin repeat domain-containing protein 27-like n=1 Tax=Tribolium madens TaxID=41895 RepID=UPI001CF745FF|nr:ankyrin repeat domain-containing protein 27-like [Tribolium madens]